MGSYPGLSSREVSGGNTPPPQPQVLRELEGWRVGGLEGWRVGGLEGGLFWEGGKVGRVGHPKHFFFKFQFF